MLEQMSIKKEDILIGRKPFSGCNMKCMHEKRKRVTRTRNTPIKNGHEKLEKQKCYHGRNLTQNHEVKQTKQRRMRADIKNQVICSVFVFVYSNLVLCQRGYIQSFPYFFPSF